MKINGIQLDELLLKVSLIQFESVPAEAEIHHPFSQRFQEEIRRTSRKSKRAAWRIWQSPVKRAIIIAVFVTVLLAVVVWATQGIRHATVDYDKPHIPQVVETYYIPTFEPKGFTLLYRDRYDSGVCYHWSNENSEHIIYEQTEGKREPAGIDMDGNTRSTKMINGFFVEIVSNEPVQYFAAVWTDDRYTYSVDIHVSGCDPYPILEALINSLIAVGATD